MYDFESRKKREVSFTMTFIHEGYFPYKEAMKEKAVDLSSEVDPVTFFPTREAVLDEDELKSYGFTSAEQDEVSRSTDTWVRTLSRDVSMDYAPWWFAGGGPFNQRTTGRGGDGVPFGGGGSRFANTIRPSQRNPRLTSVDNVER